MEQKNPFSSSQVINVSALNRMARSAIEGSLPLLWVGGEISNLTRAASGHWYFSLKDHNAQVRCAMFRGRSQFVDFIPANGDQIEVHALPTLYEARGEFQLQIEVMRRAGLGALFEAFEKLKQKLAAEGLFAESRKRLLPVFPKCLGIVTSSEAAALRDVLSTLRRRAPWLSIILYPSPVQGTGSAAKIAEAIRLAGDQRKCDVLIVCRGGGSIEDLWTFNDEQVARAIVACPIPVISGVGHETDFTIADFVADLRAATPTAAAELVCTSREQWMQRLITQHHQLARLLHRLLSARAQQVDIAARRLTHPAQRLQTQTAKLRLLAQRLSQSQTRTLERLHWKLSDRSKDYFANRPDNASQLNKLNHLQQQLTQTLRRQLENRHTALNNMAAHLEHLNPDAVLARGYSVVRNAQGKLVRNSKQLGIGDTLNIRFHQGSAEANITKTGN